MNGAGFGRITGWLFGGLVGAPILVLISDHLAFWQILLGCAISAVIGSVVGHFAAGYIWRRVRPDIDAINPRQMRALDLRPGYWMMTTNDGTDRAIRVDSLPEYTADPDAARHIKPVITITFATSTGRRLILPATQSITIIDLADPVDMVSAPE